MYRCLLLATTWTAVSFSATVDGRVVNSYTGEGVAGVAVSLMKEGANVYRASTDDQGHFRIPNVDAGTYTPTYQPKERFITASSVNQESFTISTDGRDVHLEVKVPPSGRISGRVLDRTGAPVPRAIVSLSFESSRLKLAQPVTADVDGRYSFESLPFHGSYLVSAKPPALWDSAESDGQRMGWVPTYYPGVIDPAAAAHMALPPSGELWNIDITIAKAAVWHLRGTVVDTRGDPAPNASIALSAVSALRAGKANSDGTFDFDAVSDGDYHFIASCVADGVTLRADQEVRVGGGDRDVKIQLFEPFSLHGQITTKAPDGSPSPRLPTVRLGASQSSANSSGAFILERMYPGSYRLILNGIPNGFYLESIVLGGSQTTGEQVQVVSGDAPMEIVLKYGGGTVRGTVRDCAECDITLVPTDSRLRNWSFTRIAPASAKGTFEIPSVRPGQYYALAISPETGVNIAAVEPYLQHAALITVVDNETVQAEVPHLLK